MNLSNGRLAPAPGTDGLVTRTPGALLYVASRTPVEQVRSLTELVTSHMDSEPASALARGLTALVAADDQSMLPGFAVVASSASGTYVRVYGPVEVHLRGEGDDVVLSGVGSISGSDREVTGEFHTITAQPAGNPTPAPAFDLDVQSGSTAADGFAWTTLTSPTDAPIDVPAAGGEQAGDAGEPASTGGDGVAADVPVEPPVAEGVPLDAEEEVESGWDTAGEDATGDAPAALPSSIAPGAGEPPAMADEPPAMIDTPVVVDEPPAMTGEPLPDAGEGADPMPPAEDMARDAIPFDELPVADDGSPNDAPPLTEPATMIGTLPPMEDLAPSPDDPGLSEPPPTAPPVLEKGPADAPPPAGEAPPPADETPGAPPGGGFTSQLLGALDADEGEEREALPLEQDPADVRQAEQGTVQVQVQGVICSRGHFNDPRSRFCSSCGINMVQNTQVLTNGPRPPLGVMVFEDGATFSLSSDYVVGRQPEVSELVQQGLALPLPVDDPERSISRAHAELRLVDWDVHLVNLSGTNGSFVWDETGQQWVPIPEGQSVVLTPGMRVALGRRSAVFESSLVR